MPHLHRIRAAFVLLLLAALPMTAQEAAAGSWTRWGRGVAPPADAPSADASWEVGSGAGGLVARCPIGDHRRRLIALRLRGTGEVGIHLRELDAAGSELRLDKGAFSQRTIVLEEGWREWSRLVDCDPRTAVLEVRVATVRPPGRGSAAPLAWAPAEPLVMAAGPDWLPIDAAPGVDTVPDSILDLSAWNALDPAAAGIRILADADGHLALGGAPGRRVRLVGTNLCFTANFPDHAAADLLAAELRRCGYNAVRIHHYDGLLLPPGAATLDAGLLDRLDYLASALKRRGLRIITDLHCNRGSAAGEAEEGPLDTNALKVVSALEPAAMAAWRRFPALLLPHRNPYTGLTWAEDPVVVSVGPMNENVLFVFRTGAAVKDRVERAFAAHLAAGGLDLRGAERDAAFARWLGGIQDLANQEQLQAVRDLGFNGLAAGLNHRTLPPLTLTRLRFPLVEMHAYWDHPTFLGTEWALPNLYTQQSAVAAGATWPGRWMPTRIFGRPFQFTEWNAGYPNRFRAESGVLMGAYAALQDWDGLYRFAYMGSFPEGVDPGGAAFLAQYPFTSPFRSAYDPIIRLGERIAVLLFGRGDVAPARTRSAYAASEADYPREPESWFHGGYPDDFWRRGLRHQVGSLDPAHTAGFDLITGRAPLADGTPLIAPEALPPLDRAVTSETGEIRLDPAQETLQVVTGRSEAFVLPAAGGSATGAFACASTAGFAVVAVCSHDGRALSDSRRLLVLHLTDARGTGMGFDDASGRVLRSWGGPPFLVRRGTGTLRLRLEDPAAWRCWAVDVRGSRLEQVPLIAEGEGASIVLDTAGQPQPVLAYELMRP